MALTCASVIAAAPLSWAGAGRHFQIRILAPMEAFEEALYRLRYGFLGSFPSRKNDAQAVAQYQVDAVDVGNLRTDVPDDRVQEADGVPHTLYPGSPE